MVVVTTLQFLDSMDEANKIFVSYSLSQPMTSMGTDEIQSHGNDIHSRKTTFWRDLVEYFGPALIVSVAYKIKEF